jgi:protein-S-isoprenylcysteine O-methyltransferase Ste14
VISARRHLIPAIFLIFAVITAVHAVRAGESAVQHPSPQNLLLVLYAILRTSVAGAFAMFTFDRSEPHRRAREPLAFVACAVAMVAVGLLTPPDDKGASWLLIAGDASAVCGCVWLLISVLALGRCFGVLPEARGHVSHGPYMFVRHPVYLGEIVALAGLTLAAPTTWNLLVLAAFVVAQVVRASYEERALLDAFPSYASYVEETGRLVPRVRKPNRRLVVSALPIGPGRQLFMAGSGLLRDGVAPEPGAGKFGQDFERRPSRPSTADIRLRRRSSAR